MESLRLLGGKVVIPRVVKRNVKMRPIVESRTGDRTVVKRKAERLFEMKRNA
jgi:hypothetical protein